MVQFQGARPGKRFKKKKVLIYLTNNEKADLTHKCNRVKIVMGVYKKGKNWYIDYYLKGRRKRRKIEIL